MSEQLLERLRAMNPETVEHVTPDELAVVFATIKDKRAAEGATPQPGRRGTGTPLSRWRPAVVFAAAFALVAVVVGGGLLLTRGLDRSVEVTETPPPTTTSIPEPSTPSTMVPTPVEPLSWSVITVEDFPTEGVINALVETSGRFFAGGSDHASGAAAIWDSDDGTTSWQRAASAAFGSSPLPGERRTVIIGLASHSGRIVAVGVDTAADFSSGERVAAVWYSLDGNVWTRVAHDPAVFGPAGFVAVNAVVAPFNAGFVAVGSDVWTSGDGIVWERHDLGEGTAFAVIETDDALLAGGTTGSGDAATSTGHAAVWMSTDIGTEWTRVAVILEPSGFDTSIITGMTRTDEGFLAVGGVGRTGAGTWPAVWSSDDGATWELSWVGENVGMLHDVTATAARLIAVGEDTTTGSAAAWHSADSGATWVEDSELLLPVVTSGIEAVLPIPGQEDALFAAGHHQNAPTIWTGFGEAATLGAQEATTTTAVPEETAGSTCQALVDNGAVWVPGEWDEDAGYYIVRDVPGPLPTPCVDILDIHTTPRHWRVAWEGTIADGVEVGFLLVFEQGIHGTVYEQREIDTASDVWITQELDPDPDKPFTFVAMPHSFDNWESITFTLTPCTTPYCR